MNSEKISVQDQHIIDAYIKAARIGLSGKDKIAYYRGLLDTVGNSIDYMIVANKKNSLCPGYVIAFKELAANINAIPDDTDTIKKRLKTEWRKLEKDAGCRISINEVMGWK